MLCQGSGLTPVCRDQRLIGAVQRSAQDDSGLHIHRLCPDHGSAREAAAQCHTEDPKPPHKETLHLTAKLCAPKSDERGAPQFLFIALTSFYYSIKWLSGPHKPSLKNIKKLKSPLNQAY